MAKEELGDPLGGVAEEARLLQVAQPTLRLQVELLHSGQQAPVHPAQYNNNN